MNRLRGQRTIARAGIAMSIVVMVLAMVQVCPAQATKPTTTPAFENQAIRRSAQPVESNTTTRTAAEADVAAAPAKLVDLRRLVLSLAIVLGLIFIACAVAKRFFPNVTGARTNSAVKILTRSPLAHKRQVLLMQVGRRVLVVADNGTQMNSLSEITDPDEVAQLIGQIAGPNGSAEGDQAFQAAFGKAKTDYETSENEPMPDPGLAEVEPPAGEAPDVSEAHSEINGLMEKVRRLTRQLSKS